MSQGGCFAAAAKPLVVWSQPVMRSQRHNVIAICLMPAGSEAACGRRQLRCSLSWTIDLVQRLTLSG